MASGGDGQATVSFSAPATNGGAAISSYTVTASPGGRTATGSASPLTVTGLTNGTSYTFTVTATNALGTGPASAASNSMALRMPDISKRAARVVAAGKLLFGETRWQSPMVRLCGVSPALMQKIASAEDSRGVTDDVYHKIAKALIAQADRLRKDADKLDKIAGAMLRELEE